MPEKKYIDVPVKKIGDQLSSEEFNEILDALNAVQGNQYGIKTHHLQTHDEITINQNDSTDTLNSVQMNTKFVENNVKTFCNEDLWATKFSSMTVSENKNETSGSKIREELDLKKTPKSNVEITDKNGVEIKNRLNIEDNLLISNKPTSFNPKRYKIEKSGNSITVTEYTGNQDNNDIFLFANEYIQTEKPSFSGLNELTNSGVTVETADYYVDGPKIRTIDGIDETYYRVYMKTNPNLAITALADRTGYVHFKKKTIFHAPVVYNDDTVWKSVEARENLYARENLFVGLSQYGTANPANNFTTISKNDVQKYIGATGDGTGVIVAKTIYGLDSINAGQLYSDQSIDRNTDKLIVNGDSKFVEDVFVGKDLTVHATEEGIKDSTEYSFAVKYNANDNNSYVISKVPVNFKETLDVEGLTTTTNIKNSKNITTDSLNATTGNIKNLTTENTSVTTQLTVTGFTDFKNSIRCDSNAPITSQSNITAENLTARKSTDTTDLNVTNNSQLNTITGIAPKNYVTNNTTVTGAVLVKPNTILESFYIGGVHDLYGYTTPSDTSLVVHGDMVTFQDTGCVNILGTLDVTNGTHLKNILTVDDNTDLNGTLTVAKASHFESTAAVDGATKLNSTLTVDGVTTLNNQLKVVGDSSSTTLGGTLTVANNSTFNHPVTMNLGTDPGTSDVLTINGSTAITRIKSKLRVQNVSDFEGNVSLGLKEDGETKVTSNLTIHKGGISVLEGTIGVSQGNLTVSNTATDGTPIGATSFNTKIFQIGQSETHSGSSVTVYPASNFKNGVTISGYLTANTNFDIGAAGTNGSGFIRCPLSIIQGASIAKGIVVTGGEEISGGSTIAGGLNVTSGSVKVSGWTVPSRVPKTKVSGDSDWIVYNGSNNTTNYTVDAETEGNIKSYIDKRLLLLERMITLGLGRAGVAVSYNTL